MSHRLVEGDGLRTTYASIPRVTVLNEGEDRVRIVIEFASSPVHGSGQEFRVTRLTFERVVEYSWDHFEFSRIGANKEDVRFALIEVTDSTIVAELRESSRRPPPDIRHYRLCFDDHGTYDVASGRLQIDYEFDRS